MNKPEDSKLVKMEVEEIAAVILTEGALGGPDEVECEDPILWQLWAPVAYYVMGDCLPFAIAHAGVTGGSLCLHEVRQEGSQQWHLRHAFVGLDGCPDEGVYHPDDLDDCEILDAFGGGYMTCRGELYAMQGEHRVSVLGRESMLAKYGHYNGRRELEDGKMIPGVAAALGLPFDLKEAVVKALGRDEFACAEFDNGDIETLREWAESRIVPTI